jgi:dimethylglycine dehydrogenase
MQRHLFDRLMETGRPHGLRMFGARAQNWLRQEKSYRAFGADIGRDATPLESGLERFVDLTKDFRGKEAMERTGIRSKCATLLIDGPEDADPWGREALFHGAERVGRLTSGGWSVAFGRQIGLGYLPPELAVPGTKLKLRMFRELFDAEVVEDSPHDPSNARIRIDG